MYSTCIFCHSDLGKNEAIENFPVGTRLAFESAKGRLWVICRRCERWNLTPLEERWEAVEECERQFERTKLRYSTDQIGLARVGDGVDLIRIGTPLLPEFAAWRYGDQFNRRRRKKHTLIGSAIIGGALLVAAGPVFGLSVLGGGGNAYNIIRFGADVSRRMRVIARAPSPAGGEILLRGSDVDSAVLLPAVDGKEWGIRVKHRLSRNPQLPWWTYDGQTAASDLHGAAALKVAAILLPRLNHEGASKSQVREAVSLVQEGTDPSVSFHRAARMAERPSFTAFGDRGRLKLLPVETRLALEMISHEDTERRALAGELYLLEDAWREAEEIAAIADGMFLPAEIERDMEEMKHRSTAN